MSSEEAENVAAKVERMELHDDTADDNNNKGDIPVEEAATEEETKDDDDETSVGNEDDDDDDDTIGSSDESDMNISPEKADTALLEATNLKEEGNNHFKEGDLDKASRAYRRGCNTLKPLNKSNTGEEQVKALLLALQNNLAMVLFKQGKFRMSVQVATRALTVDPTNVKALYRRALAQRKQGNLNEARADLKDAIKADPNNAACKKELLQIKKELETARESQKKALSKAFSKSGSSFLYNDREEEEKKKEEAKKRKKQQEQELYKKRKAEWEDECVKRMANNQPAISFEEWEKEQKDAEEKQKKELEKKKKEEEKKRREERKKAKAAAKAHLDDESDDELTEADLKFMRGYKKTKDGRTTSYFTRELSEEEKKAIGDIAPKRLDETGASTTSPNVPQRLASSTDGASRPSAWNQAGTWEEKDTTAWCKEQLQKRLEETIVASNLDVEITSVEELTGDASVAIAGGKKRYIFDFHASLKYDVKDPSEEKVIASGIVKLPDICSTSHEELEVSFGAWKKRPPAKQEQMATDCQRALVDELRMSVQRWVNDFNQMY